MYYSYITYTRVHTRIHTQWGLQGSNEKFRKSLVPFPVPGMYRMIEQTSAFHTVFGSHTTDSNKI